MMSTECRFFLSFMYRKALGKWSSPESNNAASSFALIDFPSKN